MQHDSGVAQHRKNWLASQWLVTRGAEIVRANGLRKITFHSVLFLASAGLTTVSQLFAPLSKNKNGEYEYSTQSAVFFSEITKLVLSLSALAYEHVSRKKRKSEAPEGELPVLPGDPLRQARVYFVPGFLWFANNNITFYVLQGISPSAFQVIGQAKVVFTVVLLYFLMGRRFNLQQLLSLAVLSCALIITGEEEDANRVHQGRREPGSHYTLNVGVAVLLTLVIAFNGSLAGVYNEKMLKELNSSLHFQNALAYAWGCMFNFCWMFLVERSREIILVKGLTSGYNGWTVAYVITSASMGLSVSLIFKYQDNIARIMAQATSIALTLLLSVPVLGQRVTVSETCSVGLIAISLLSYYDGAERQKLDDQARLGTGISFMPAAAKESTPLVAGSGKV